MSFFKSAAIDKRIPNDKVTVYCRAAIKGKKIKRTYHIFNWNRHQKKKNSYNVFITEHGIIC